ncbi:hypothetical protein ILYODFUR_036004 [Ilyodon furcidens]|uniref:Uncharacterized protein n=1 Tax=Ilyodon furcidens TaxID=33524 RepID=A0ABV0T310_9TELE
MKVGMCDCVCLIFVSGWVLGCSISWNSLGPHQMWPIPSPSHYLLVVGISARRCTCDCRYPGLGALVCAGSLLVAVCWGLNPWALSGLCLGNDMSRGPWLDLLGCRRLSTGPVGSLLQVPEASALWLLGGSPGILPCSSLGGLR